ncbi:M28 family peptidase [Dactylosporangium sp. NPDC051541]|uniref:M28 family peptidase n=1 Tax=Dactylosporangium sp. NPDC051541 TaxID=3363977 RepID=UPI0037BA4C25
MSGDERLLRDVVEELAALNRLATSPGERAAAVRIRDLLREHGWAAETEPEPVYRSYARPIGLLLAAGLVAGLAAGRRGSRRGRWIGAAGGALAAAGIVDDISAGPMLARRALQRRRLTDNVVATLGPASAPRTLCVTVHHDAAPSGVVFDPRPMDWVARRFPALVEAATANPPLWWPVVAGPALIGAGSLARSDRLRRLGLVLAAGSLAAMADIARRPAVPGANDNLSGVAAALGLAAELHARPVSGLRVVIVSAGAEEALQQGIIAFGRRHFPALPTASTWFLNLDTVGSGRLVLLEGEGPVRMRDYDQAFKELIAECAADEHIPLLRGLRSRNSTDGCIPARAGYPAATLVSVDERKLLPHYHLMSDRPEHVRYDSVAATVRLAAAVARRLAPRP